ncbi:MAG: hypothetical protein IT198_17205 [Acidimicrobiia bacterium]|nr:hypothetical protein [Acidimicrobiia bacterium]
MRRRLRLRAAAENRFLLDTRKIAVLGSVCLVLVVLWILVPDVGPAPGAGEDTPPGTHPTPATPPVPTADPADPPDGEETPVVPALEVPTSMRTVTVVVPDPLGLDAGDTVDVLVTLDADIATDATAALRVVRRATVRSVAPADTGPGEVTVSLIVTPDDVGRVEFASRRGTVALSLTPAAEDGAAPSEPLPPDGSAGGGSDPGHDEDHDE